MKRMRDVNIKKKIIKIALVTSMLILVPVGLAVFGYQLTTNKYQLPKEITDFILETQSEIPVGETIIEEVPSDVKLNTKTLYYVFDDGNQEIAYMLIELLNSKNNKMMFLTVPTATKVTVSNTLYQTMKDTYVSIPQIMKLSKLYQYFDNEVAYTYGVDIIEEAFGIHIDYHAIISLEEYEKIFISKSDGVQMLNDKWLKWADGAVTQKGTKGKISEFHEKLQTDFSLENRYAYLETYEKLTASDFIFEIISGEKKNEAYVPNVEEIKRKILEFY